MMYDKSISADRSDTGFIKRLIWWYFWLLIFEGALRKWIFPGQANALLIVRDPVLLLIYFEAIKKGIFPKNGFIITAIILAVFSFFIGMLIHGSSVLVTLYGVRTNFLYIPLLFIMADVLDLDDVIKIGRWLLIICIPMAALFLMQFFLPLTHPLNSGATELMLKQSTSIDNIVRPAGTFSYNTGTSSFVGLVFSFLMYGILDERRNYSGFLIFCSAIALGVSVVVSGNRGLIVNVIIVLAAALYVLLRKPKFIGRFAKWLIIIALALIIILPATTFFEKGIHVLAVRFESDGGVKTGLIQRFLNGTVGALDLITHAPVLGYGIGRGTNVGSVLLVGAPEFLLAENEWERIFLESGGILGFAFILLRFGILVYVFRSCSKALAKDNIFPLLLFASTLFGLFSGQWGQPAVLGFAVFNAGICLASCRTGKT